MSFLDDIVDVGKSVGSFFTGGSAAGNLASSVVTLVGMGFLASQLSKNTNADTTSDTPATVNIDNGVRLQVEASASNKVPVLYGEAYFGGIITDAQMSADALTMYYCLTLSERTGNLLSTGAASTYTFKDIHWNDQRIVFKTDGITVDYTVDRSGVVDHSLKDLVKIYCYAGNSDTPQVPQGYTNGSLPAAYNVFPDWTADTHDMNDLIFAVVEVTYSQANGVDGLGTVIFQIENSMSLPGDVLYDYMKSERYGAGIATAEILA